MPIYLSDLLLYPNILMRSLPPGHKSRAQLAEEREDAMYEALGRLVEEHPIVSPLRPRGPRQ
jgi:hypothetical protein